MREGMNRRRLDGRRGTRVLFAHRGFDPDSPAAQLSRTIMGNGWRRVLT